jgi:ubiquinone/menaquinone biosynthesis C-methylase UbiE
MGHFKTILASAIKRLHSPIYERRLQELVRQITPHLREGDHVLDVGCGFGALGKEIMGSSNCPPQVKISGLERIERGNELIEVKFYDGNKIPYPDDAFDVVILADVLHHEKEPHRLIKECARVAKRLLIIKDHKTEGVFARQRISFLDWAANMPFNIPCLYRYNTREEWRRWHESHGLIVEYELNSMRLYPPIVNFIFGRRLQYFVVLRTNKK